MHIRTRLVKDEGVCVCLSVKDKKRGRGLIRNAILLLCLPPHAPLYIFSNLISRTGNKLHYWQLYFFISLSVSRLEL